MQALISQGASINESDSDGKTPLMHAICKKQTQTARALINMGTNINMRDKNCYSALSHAISYGNKEIVNLLLEKGADLKLKDCYDYSYLHIAASYNQPEIVEILLKNKMNINAKNYDGDTALHVALSYRMYEMAKLLVDNGADVNSRNNYRSTPLHYAVKYGHVSKTTKLMSDYILSKNQNTGITAKLMIDYILSKNPNTGIRDSWGYTPLSLAAYYKDKDMADVLRARSKGSDENDQEEVFNEVIDTALRYKIIKQTAGLAERIRESAEFKIRDIDYSAVNANEIGYSNNEEWNTEKADVPKTFADSCLKLLKDEGGVNKKITMIKSDENVNDGVVVDVAVKRIILNWNYFDQKPDVYLCDINFTDSRNGQKLFSGMVNITTRSAEGARVGSMRSMNAGRFSAGFSYSIPVNPGMPGWEGTFSGRLHIAAYNMAWIVTKIMIDGKIEPSEQ